MAFLAQSFHWYSSPNAEKGSVLKTFVPRFEILPEAQRAIWPELSPCKDLGFVLYGDTAIALRLGHRSSIDFDFFSHIPLDENKEQELMIALPFLNDSERIQFAPDTRSYLTAANVKISFLGGIRLGRIGEPQATDDGVLRVASLDDLMAVKLAAILQRVEAKDYKDIAAMLRSGVSLGKGMAGSVALYGRQFPPSESLKALTYFHGGDMRQLPQQDKETLLEAARTLLLRELPQIKRMSDNLTE